jgi:hypothetical protein
VLCIAIPNAREDESFAVLAQDVPADASRAPPAIPNLLEQA